MRDLFRRTRIVATAGFWLAAHSVFAQSVSSSQSYAFSADSVWRLDPRVVQVVSGGAWKADGRSGQYRIVVRSDGADTVHYSTIVQWMARGQDLGQELTLVATVNLGSLDSRWYSLLDPELKLSRGRWLLIVDAAEAPLRTARHRPQYWLGVPGQVTRR